MERGKVGERVRKQLACAAELTVASGPVPTQSAFLDTLSEPSNGVQAHVGAFSWRAVRDPVARKWKIKATIKTGLNSFLYHIPSMLGIPDNMFAPNGPMAANF